MTEHERNLEWERMMKEVREISSHYDRIIENNARVISSFREELRAEVGGSLERAS